MTVASGSLTLRGDWINLATLTQTAGAINLYDTFDVTDLRNPGVSSAFPDNGGEVNIYGQLNDAGTLTIGNAWRLVGGSVTGTTISGEGH